MLVFSFPVLHFPAVCAPISAERTFAFLKMKNRFLILAFLALSLTSCASYHPAITQPAVRQIRPGITTEPDLNTIFGPPDTRIASYNGDIFLTWFRSVPPGPSGYVPIVGQFMGGLDLHVQQMNVFLTRSGRVRSFTIYDSNGLVRTENSQIHSGGPAYHGK